MSKRLTAYDVQAILFDDVEAGQISEDEEEDHLEIQSSSDDENPENENGLLNHQITSGNNHELIIEKQESLSKIQIIQPSSSLMFVNEAQSILSSSSSMSISSLNPTLPASSSSMSITSEIFFKKPSEASNNKSSNLTNQHYNPDFKTFDQKSTISSLRRKSIKINKETPMIKDVEDKIFGKRTQEMLKKNFLPYSWDTKPMQNSFVPLKNYSDKPKLSELVKNCETLSDFFNFFINNSIIDIIIRATNEKIFIYHEKHPKISKTLVESVTIFEIRAFFGLLLLFGALRKADVDISELWSTESPQHCSYATSAMPRDRFRLLSVCITFDDFQTRKTRKVLDKKFYKISEIFNMFVSNIKSAFIAGFYLCIDETLYSYRGHCAHRQYMPKKPAKYGLKFFNIVCVETSYLLDCLPYLGKSDTNEKNSKNVGQKTVENLASPFYGSSRCITMDNFFTSIPLAKILFENKLSLIGTLRNNKNEIPPSFLQNKIKEVFSSQFAFDKFMTLVSYTPKRDKSVILLSTQHHDSAVTLEIPKEHQAQNKSNKPIIITDYNATKGGVDTLDHLVEAFSCRRKTNRWTFNTLMYIFDVCAYNSYVLHKLKFPEKYEKNSCRGRRLSLQDLAIELIMPGIKERAEKIASKNFSGCQSPISGSIKKTGVSLFTKLSTLVDISPNRSDTKRKYCQFCEKKNNDSRYKITCCDCNLPVCPDHSKIYCLICCKK